MIHDLLDEKTIKVMKEAYEIAKIHTTGPDDTFFVAGAFLNVAKLLYIESMGEENTRRLFQNIIEQSFNIKQPTLH